MCQKSGKIANVVYGWSHKQDKMWIIPSERISTHCVVFKSPGSQVYLNFLFNGHFFYSRANAFSWTFCQTMSIKVTISYHYVHGVFFHLNERVCKFYHKEKLFDEINVAGIPL